MKIGSGNIRSNNFLLQVFAISLVVSILSGCGNNHSPISFDGETMGTYYSVKYHLNDNVQKNDKQILKAGTDSILIDVNQKMSTYIEDSELSVFNTAKDTGWKDASSELVSIIAKANEISIKSEGAYDITIGPLVNLWGFGPVPGDDSVPPAEKIDSILNETGYYNLQYRFTPPALKKLKTDIYVDLSSIAKGYGVDVVARYLDSKGITDYLVEIGGELRTRGLNGEIPWRIGILKANEESGIEAVLNLSNVSVATSGDYFNYFENDGIRYSHTIDPETGRPITHKLASVTVIAEDCMTADAMATAIEVLGPDKGMKFANNEKLPVLFIVKGKDGFFDVNNNLMAKYLNKKEKD